MTNKYKDFIKYIDENNLRITKIINPTIDIITTQNYFDKFEIQYANKYSYIRNIDTYIIKNRNHSFKLPITIPEDTIKKICKILNDENVKQNKEKM